MAVDDVRGGLVGMAPQEDVGQLREGRVDVQQPQPRDRAADVVVRDRVAHERERLGKIVVVPERGPGNENQEQPHFEQQGHYQEPSEQESLASGLSGVDEALDAGRHIAIADLLGLERGEHGQRPIVVAHLLEHPS
jgi:hypothetical protein